MTAQGIHKEKTGCGVVQSMIEMVSRGGCTLSERDACSGAPKRAVVRIWRDG